MTPLEHLRARKRERALKLLARAMERVCTNEAPACAHCLQASEPDIDISIEVDVKRG